MTVHFDHDLDNIADGDPSRLMMSHFDRLRQPLARQLGDSVVPAFMYGSLVYGSSKAIGDHLRAYEGGRMRVVDDFFRGPMLPTVGSVNMPLDRS
ncbi:hypothetical protein GPECTOR_37g142 [Gonium pectorale]|uniref:Uncharacterized protein n=1 Tax=Gonium pectorale TaxID=33097 RepID=A0A150GBA8_GONPE|nr:hypothetical protein GPECTOR_37g142 [Gonium pectorale]|eukprot:KXZ47137.1 hypothetical protein GPECTOR_37g142 [Gonium pectorale]